MLYSNKDCVFSEVGPTMWNDLLSDLGAPFVRGTFNKYLKLVLYHCTWLWRASEHLNRGAT